MSQAPSANPTPPPAPARPPDGSLGRELGGDLPCISCGYNLRGLSIRSMCPECGVGVRATILHVVDPQASELQPIGHPRVIATAVVLWGAGAAMAGVLAWLPHLADLFALVRLPLPSRPEVGLGVLIGIAISGVGSIGLWRPHAGVPGRTTTMAIVGSALYLPLLWSEWMYFMQGGSPHYSTLAPVTDNVRWFVLAAALIALIIAFVRPSARLLVARSLAMRTGRVDRQRLLVMAAAAGLMVAGGLFVAATGFGPGGGLFAETSMVAGVGAIALGSALLTIGLIGSFADCMRIAQAIVYPRPSVRQVIRKGAQGPKSRLGRMLDPSMPRESES